MSATVPDRAGAPTRRPGGRSARVAAAVYDAVGQLMAETKPDRLTVPMIAERAGVNPTSIYRRWGEVDNLLEEVAVAALTRDGDVAPDTGTMAGDLREWARIIAADIAQPKRSRYLRAMASARDGVVEHCPCTESRRAQAEEMTARGRERGEPVPTVDQVIDHVVLPMYGRVFLALGLDRADADRVVDDVLALAR